MRIWLKLVLLIVTACAVEGPGPDGLDTDDGALTASDTDVTDGLGLPVALRVTPAAFLLRAEGEVAAPKVEAVDSEGRVVRTVDPSEFTLTSPDQDVARVDRSTIIAGDEPGGIMIDLHGPDGLSARIGVMRAVMQAGVIGVRDEDVVAAPELVSQHGSLVGARYRWTHGGAPLTVGTRIVALGASPIGGEVVAVEDTSAGQQVTFETVPYADLIQAPLDLRVPIDPATLALDPEVEGVFELDRKTGSFVPIADDTGAPVADLRQPTATLTCRGTEAGARLIVVAGAQVFRPDLSIDVSFSENPRILLTGSVRIRASFSVVTELSGSFERTCRLPLGHVPFGSAVVPLAGILPLYVSGDVSFGVGLKASGEADIPETRLVSLDREVLASVTTGFRCEGGDCGFVADMSSQIVRDEHEVLTQSAEVTVAHLRLDAFGYAAAGLTAWGVVSVDLAEVRAGLRLDVTKADSLAVELDDPLFRSDIEVSLFRSAGSSDVLRALVDVLRNLLSAWLPLDPEIDLSPLSEEVVVLESLPTGGLAIAGGTNGAPVQFTVTLDRTTFLDEENVESVSVLIRDGADWVVVATGAATPGSPTVLEWSPPATLTGYHRFAPAVRTRGPWAWDVEPADNAVRVWDVPSCGNGLVEVWEDCDDANADHFDGCSNMCTLPGYCGNYLLDPGEDCDDGNVFSGDACPDTCHW